MKVMKIMKSNENNWTDDWSETISAVKNGQDEQRGNPDWYMFTGENYIVRTDDTASEIGDIDASDQGYEFYNRSGRIQDSVRLGEGCSGNQKFFRKR